MTKLEEIKNRARSILDLFDCFEATERKKVKDNGPLLISYEQKDFIQKLVEHRSALCVLLTELTPDQLNFLRTIDDVFDASERLRGTLYGQPLSNKEENLLLKCKETFTQNWTSNRDAFTAFIILSYYNQPFNLLLQKNISSLSDAEATRYLHYTMRQPHLMGTEDEELYINYYKDLTAWLLSLLKEKPNSFILDAIKQKLTFGACYYVDCSTKGVIDGRAKIIQEVIAQTPALNSITRDHKKTPITRQKKRLGILSRNKKAYTDTRALLGMFHGFDKDSYEIYWYSLDNVDDTALDDDVFETQLNSIIYKSTSLSGDAEEMAKTILADDLDFFVLGTAYSFSVKELDILIALPLARIQVSLAALIAGSSGLPNMDYYFVPEAKGDLLKLYKEEASEKLIHIPAPLLRYKKPPIVSPSSSVTRAAIDAPEDAVLYASGAALNKLMPETLRSWISILEAVPNSFLLLFPLNPAWGGYYIATTFFARLHTVLKEFPNIDPSRVKIIRAVTPDDFERLIQLSDIYLGSFPRDGGTAAMQALRYSKPLIARKESWFHTPNDALMLRSIECDTLIAKDNAGVTQLAVKLGHDEALRTQYVKHIENKIDNAPFFDIDEQTKQIQNAFDTLPTNADLSAKPKQ